MAYKICSFKVLKQVYLGIGVPAKAMSIMDSFISGILKRLFPL